MIDTHCHILPGIDDGAPDRETAVAMARIAAADGVTTVVATPHVREGDWWNERPKVLGAIAEFRRVLEDEGIPLEIAAGSEVHLAPRLPERVRDGRLLTYGDAGRWLLLECPYRTRPVRIEETIFELKLAGITPVIAHPERTRWFLEDPSRWERMVELGALGQMTSSSLLGTFGKAIRALSEEWVRRGLVHVLGSDAHDPEYRPPALAAARDRWAELAGEEAARRATLDWPRAFLTGEPVEPPPPRPPDPRRRGFLARLFGR